MMIKDSIKSQESGWMWLFKILTGLLIVALITVHFIVNHLISSEGLLSYEEIVIYYKNWFVPIMEIGFLLFAITHSLLGIRSIVLDLNPPPKRLRLVTLALILIGVGFITYGIWLVLEIKSF